MITKAINLNKLKLRFAGYCFDYENICKMIYIIKNTLFNDDEVSFLLKKSHKEIEKAFNNKRLGEKIYRHIELKIDSNDYEKDENFNFMLFFNNNFYTLLYFLKPQMII